MNHDETKIDENTETENNTQAAADPLDERKAALREKYPKRELRGIKVDGEMLLGLYPRKQETERYVRDMALRGMDKAIGNLLVGIFPAGEERERLDERLEDVGQLAITQINKTALAAIGIEAEYQYIDDMSAEDLDTGFIIKWRKPLRKEVNKMLAQIKGNPMASMRDFVEAVVTEPEPDELREYLSSKPGRAVALYGKISDKCGGAVNVSIKKL